MKELFYMATWFFAARLLGRKKPLQTVLAILNKCNLTCLHCSEYQRENPIVKSYEQIREELSYAYQTGSRIIDFQGGEPMLWRDGEHDLNSLIHLAKQMGFYSVSITTNALLPFQGLEADIVWVSLDGLGDYHDAIRGKGAFEKLIANITSCGHKNLSVNMVVNTLNYTSVEETISFVRDHPNIKAIAINFHTPRPATDYLFLDWEVRGQVIDKVLQMKRAGYPVMNSASGLRLMKSNNFKKQCWISGYILPDGSRYEECPGKLVGLCERCGYTMAGEMKCVFDLRPDTIISGIKMRLK